MRCRIAIKAAHSTYCQLQLYTSPSCLSVLLSHTMMIGGSLYPIYMIKQTSSNHQANVERTLSKRQAIRAHVVHMYFECICWMFAR